MESYIQDRPFVALALYSGKVEISLSRHHGNSKYDDGQEISWTRACQNPVTYYANKKTLVRRPTDAQERILFRATTGMFLLFAVLDIRAYLLLSQGRRFRRCRRRLPYRSNADSLL